MFESALESQRTTRRSEFPSMEDEKREGEKVREREKEEEAVTAAALEETAGCEKG